MNQSTTVWPAYADMFRPACVHAPEFEHTLSTVASVDPDVLVVVPLSPTAAPEVEVRGEWRDVLEGRVPFGVYESLRAGR